MAQPSEKVLSAIAEHTHPSVPYPIVLAMAERETRFDPSQVGRDGEFGLLQIMPETAREWGYKGPFDALFDPRINVAVATEGLSRLFGRFHTWPEAIRAYNGSGPEARAYSVGVLKRLPVWSDFVKANRAIFQAVVNRRTLKWGIVLAAVVGAVFLLSRMRQPREVEA